MQAVYHQFALLFAVSTVAPQRGRERHRRRRDDGRQQQAEERIVVDAVAGHRDDVAFAL